MKKASIILFILSVAFVASLLITMAHPVVTLLADGVIPVN